MKKFGRGHLNELLVLINLIDIVKSYGINVEKRGQHYVCLCPFHEEKTPSFTIDEAHQFYHCLSCGDKGNAISFVMQKDGIAFNEAILKLEMSVCYLGKRKRRGDDF